MAAPTDVALFTTVAAATGVKFDTYLSVSSFGYDGQIAEMRSASSLMNSVEGINEGDASLSSISYGGQNGYAAIQSVQTALYNATKSDPNLSALPVIGPSYGNLAQIGRAANTASVSDEGNTHDYFSTGNPPGAALGAITSQASLVSGTDPLVATETGYYTGASLSGSNPLYQVSGVSQTVQAKYDLTILFDDWKAGIKTTYLYELLDDANDPNNTNNEDHYGLFDADGTPKLAATAIHDLTATLADNGPARTDSFGYQIAGAPSTANSLLLEKSTGVFDLAVWNDIRLSDSVTGAELVNPAVPVTLAFGQYVKSVIEYDPLAGTGGVQTWFNVSSININLPDHPVLFEITPYTASQFSLQSFVLPQTIASGQSTANLWTALLADATNTDPNKLTGLTVKSVGTNGTAGVIHFNAATQSVVYTAPTYSPLAPTDSFTFTLADAAGDTVTGTVAITETPPANTLYDTVAGLRINAPASGYTLVSLSAGQQLYSDFSGVTFIGAADTAMYGGGSNNIFSAGDGNHIVGGGNFSRVTLGNGNNTIGLNGTGNVIVAGNGDNLLYKSTGDTSITMGNGNESITAGGQNNVIRVGAGTSSIDVGVDGSAAGNESVTVGGGTNTIHAGGAGDTILVQGGTNNLIVASGSAATITVVAGSNTVVVQGASSVTTTLAGNNLLESASDGEVFNLGSGNDSVWAAGNSNRIIAGTGTASITFLGKNDVIDVTRGTNTLTAQGSSNTLILASPGGTATEIFGNVVAANDIFDLRSALAGTNWDGRQSTLSSYLSVSSVGSTSVISIDMDGAASGPAAAIAVINNVAGLTYAGLIAQSILPVVGVPARPALVTSSITATTVGSGSDRLILQVSEDAWNGDAQFTIQVDGNQIGGTQTATAFHSAGQEQAFTVLGNFAGAHTATVTFLNDAYGGSSSTDRNLYVDGASVNGDTVSGASLTEDKPGSQSFGFTGPAPALAPITATTVGSGSDRLILQVSEDAWNGDAQFTIQVDGNQIGGTQTATAFHSAGQEQAFTVLGDFAGAHTATVTFLNDAYGGSSSTDRNLYVDSASFNRDTVSGASLTEDKPGSQSFGFTGPAPALAPVTATTVGSGSDHLILQVSEDAWNGDAQFTIQVDGNQIGGTQTATAFHSAGQEQAFTVLGDFAGAHTATVTFLNDAYGGSSSTDRNLYVDSASFNGAAVSGASLTEYSAGPQSFGFHPT